MVAANPFDVIVVGNAGIDTNIYLQGEEIDFSIEANFTENIDYIGQAGGYTSRGFAQLGWRTGFIGYVGADYHGDHIRQEFARDGIDVSAIFIDPAGTARSVNFMYPDGRRRNFYDGKSHMTLVPDLEQCRALLSNARLAHFHIPNWGRKLLHFAREAGAVVACDIQDVIQIDDPYRQEFIEQADILFLSNANLGNPIGYLRKLIANNPGQIILVGMGADGCLCATKQGIWHYAAIDMDLPVIDTNGAGDGLAVGFLSGYILEQRPLNEAVLCGQIAARYTCTIKASTDALIGKPELDKWFRQLLPANKSTQVG